jgi:hypothetical protein
MSLCDEYVAKTSRYLDNELSGIELEYFRSHFESAPIAEPIWKQRRRFPKRCVALVPCM